MDPGDETGGDILKIPVDRVDDLVPDTDVIVGSPPCVSFSSSNKAGKADKSLGIKLILKYLQIVAIKKHKSGSRLKFWLMENVPNSRFSLEQQYTFRDLEIPPEVMRKLGMRKRPDDVALTLDLSASNIFNAAHYGTPQRRERFVTGEFPRPEPSTPTWETQITLGAVLNALRKKEGPIKDPNYGFMIPHKDLTDHFYDTTVSPFEWESARIKKEQARYYGRMPFPEDETQPSRTIMATRSVVSRESMILSNGAPHTYRAPTIREVASLMGFPITYLFQANNEGMKYRLVGNAVCVPLSAAFAKAMLKEMGSRQHPQQHVADKSKLLVDLRKVLPPPKQPRDRHPSAGFSEIVPDLKSKNFRVEMDNNFPRLGNKLRWRASIHHGTGKDGMKKSMPDELAVINLLKNAPGQQKIKEFMGVVKREFRGKIPHAEGFQAQYCVVNPDPKYLTPRKALRRAKQLVDKHFPAEKYETVFVSNLVNEFGSRRRHLRFDPSNPPDDRIPLRHAVALYACMQICALANRGRS